MTIYADTSYFVAAYHERDAHHEQALSVTRRYQHDDWLWCELHSVEVMVTLRGLTHLRLSPRNARDIANRLARELARGEYQRRPLPLRESVSRAQEVAEVHLEKQHASAFDVWHVAAACELGCSRFVSFDDGQVEIARLAGLTVA